MSVMQMRCVTEARWLSRGMFNWVDWAKLALAASSTMRATGRSRLYTEIPPQISLGTTCRYRRAQCLSWGGTERLDVVSHDKVSNRHRPATSVGTRNLKSE